MKVQGEYTFDSPPERVWEGLLDPDVLAATMPGCRKLERTGEDEYEGELDIRVGPVQGKFQGRVKLEEKDPPNGYTMKVDGRGAPGFVKATARVEIAATGAGGTRLAYDGDAQVGGRIAGVGQRLLDSSAKSIIRQSLEGLDAQLRARSSPAPEADAADAATARPAAGRATPGAAAEEGERPSPPAAPSQARFAARVARDVAGDLLPRPVWIALAVVLAAIVLWLLIG